MYGQAGDIASGGAGLDGFVIVEYEPSVPVVIQHFEPTEGKIDLAVPGARAVTIAAFENADGRFTLCAKDHETAIITARDLFPDDIVTATRYVF